MRSAGILFVLLLLLAVPTSGARAYTLIPMDLEQLSAQAEFVVLGRVVRQEARFNSDRTRILTRTMVEVERRIAGAAPPVFEVAEYGGRVGDHEQVSTGQVRFQTGERLLLFVCRDALDLLRTCGARQGRLDVTGGTDGLVTVRGWMAGERVAGTLDELRARIVTARGGSR